MNRSRTEKGEQSRKRLLEAAAEEFANNGYDRTRVSDIVKRAGLTQAAFYLYFPSKEAVYGELRDAFFTQLRVLADAGKQVTPLPKEMTVPKIRENLLRLFRFFGACPRLTQVFLAAAQEGELLHRQMAKLVAENLRTNQNAGHVRPELSPEVAAEAMVAVLYRLTERFLLTGEMTAEELADHATALLASGIVSPERSTNPKNR